MYIPNPDNNRVLGYPAIPTTNGAAASFVLGQPDFTHSAANTNGGAPPDAAGMSLPGMALEHDGPLFVVVAFTHRILIWTTEPTTTQTPVAVVVGQPNMTTTTTMHLGRAGHQLCQHDARLGRAGPAGLYLECAQ